LETGNQTAHRWQLMRFRVGDAPEPLGFWIRPEFPSPISVSHSSFWFPIAGFWYFSF
jgi:hypothetical protein